MMEEENCNVEIQPTVNANMQRVREGMMPPAVEEKMRRSAKDIVGAMAPTLLEVAVKSTYEHMTSDNINERALGQKQLHSLLPFIMPKQSEVNIKSEGHVSEDVQSAINKALGKQ